MVLQRQKVITIYNIFHIQYKCKGFCHHFKISSGKINLCLTTGFLPVASISNSYTRCSSDTNHNDHGMCRGKGRHHKPTLDQGMCFLISSQPELLECHLCLHQSLSRPKRSKEKERSQYWINILITNKSNSWQQFNSKNLFNFSRNSKDQHTL